MRRRRTAPPLLSDDDLDLVPELGLVRIQTVLLADIKPHPLNDKIYGRVDPDDPDVQALAQSIRDYGVKEPLVLTSDLYILSGHRRRVAAGLAGLEFVPCRVEDFDSDNKALRVNKRSIWG